MVRFIGGPYDGCCPAVPAHAVAGDVAIPILQAKPAQVFDVEVSRFMRMLMESRRINLYVLAPEDREASGFARYICQCRDGVTGFYWAGPISLEEYNRSSNKLIPMEKLDDSLAS